MAVDASSEEELLKRIEYLRIDLYGSGYDLELENQIKNEFSKYNLKPVVRGQRGPACGPEIILNLFVQIPPDLLYMFLEKIIELLILKISSTIWSRMVRKIKNFRKEDILEVCFPGKVQIGTEEYDICILVSPAYGVSYKDIKMKELIDGIVKMAETEIKNGHHVFKVTVPAGLALEDSKYFDDESLRTNYSLWKVDYREIEPFPSLIYVVPNKTFMPCMDEDAESKRIHVNDVFLTKNK